MLAQPDRRPAPSRSPPPTTSISAIPNGPRSWASSSMAIKGIGEACRALDFPIVSGNVSLYNETNGRGILPTPTIGGVGLIPDWRKMARIGFAGRRRGDPAGRRAGRLGHASRPVDLSARHPRPRRTARRRRSISRTRTQGRRFRPLADPRRHGDRRARPLRRRPGAWRSPKWRWLRASAPNGRSSASVAPHAAVLRRGPGPLSRDGRLAGHGRARRARCGRCRRSGIRSRGSARLAAMH